MVCSYFEEYLCIYNQFSHLVYSCIKDHLCNLFLVISFFFLDLQDESTWWICSRFLTWTSVTSKPKSAKSSRVIKASHSYWDSLSTSTYMYDERLYLPWTAYRRVCTVNTKHRHGTTLLQSFQETDPTVMQFDSNVQPNDDA